MYIWRLFDMFILLALCLALSGVGEKASAGSTRVGIVDSPPLGVLWQREAAVPVSISHYSIQVSNMGYTWRVSLASDGTQGNELSEDPTISADGRFVVFDSWGSNLMKGDTNGVRDVFIHDRGVQLQVV